MADQDPITDDARLITALLNAGHPESTLKIACLTSIPPRYVQEALDRMADWTPDGGDPGYPIIRRPALGPDVFDLAER